VWGIKMILSYTFYIAITLTATLFAGLAQKYSYTNNGIKIPQKFFYLLTGGILIFVMGFREYTIGVDGSSYHRIFNNINSLSLSEYYQVKHIEPMYYILNRVIGFFTSEFQWILIITSIIIVSGFLKALSYNMEKFSLPLAVFIFITTQYFYYFGIIRMGLAVAIIGYGYKYILEDKKKHFIAIVVLATTFHYSALFTLLLLLYNKHDKQTIWKVVSIIPIAFLMVRFFIFPFIGGRYDSYIERAAITIDFGFITLLPLLILFIVFYKPMKKYSTIYQFYFIVFVARMFTEIFGPFMGAGRTIWFLNLSLCFLLPGIIRVNNDRGVKFALCLITILYCLIYSYFAYFGESFRGQHMLPYKNIYFELGD